MVLPPWKVPLAPVHALSLVIAQVAEASAKQQAPSG
jgi:hypothetical protein